MTHGKAQERQEIGTPEIHWNLFIFKFPENFVEYLQETHFEDVSAILKADEMARHYAIQVEYVIVFYGWEGKWEV